jgi:hypothetical protein
MPQRIRDFDANKIDSREAYGVLIAATVACAACLDDYDGEIKRLNAISRRIEDQPDGRVSQTLGEIDVQWFLRELISKLKVTCVAIGSPPSSRPSRERDAVGCNARAVGCNPIPSDPPRHARAVGCNQMPSDPPRHARAVGCNQIPIDPPRHARAVGRAPIAR